MSKRLVSLLLAVMLLMTGVVYAEFNGSKTVADTTTSRVVTSTGLQVSADFTVTTTDPTTFSTEVYNQIGMFLPGAGAGVVKFFSDDIQSEISALLPVGLDAAKLEMNEFSALDAINYLIAYGDVTVAFKFATQYVLGQTVVVLVGVNTPVGVEWHVLEATVNADGEVEVVFPADVVTLVNANDAVLAVLSVPA